MEPRKTATGQPEDTSSEGDMFLTLAESASRGDSEAIAELVNRTRLRLFALAYAELRHYDDAHDAVAAALVQVCLHIHEVRQPERVAAWMMTVVRNEVRQQMRRRQARGNLLPLEDADNPTHPFDNTAILRVDIERALRRLPVNQERAVRLFYQSQLSSHEIAQKLGASEGAVKMWIHRARQHLVKDMKGYEPMTRPRAKSESLKPVAAVTPTPAVTSDTAAILHSDLSPAMTYSLSEMLQASGYSAVTVLTPADLDPVKWGGIGWTDRLRGKSLLVLDERIGEHSALEYLLNLKADPEHHDLLTCVLYSVAPDAFSGAAYFSAGVDSLLDKNTLTADTDDPNERRTTFQRNRVKRPRHTVYFTPRLQRAVQLAVQECLDQNEQHVRPIHLLLGLTSSVLNDGPDSPIFSGRVLQALGTPAHVVYAEIKRCLKTTDGSRKEERNPVTSSPLTTSVPPSPVLPDPKTAELSPEAKQAIDLSYEEAQVLGDNYIGTEHLLLGLVRQTESLAADVLMGFGIGVETVRKQTIQLREQDRAR